MGDGLIYTVVAFTIVWLVLGIYLAHLARQSRSNREAWRGLARTHSGDEEPGEVNTQAEIVGITSDPGSS